MCVNLQLNGLRFYQSFTVEKILSRGGLLVLLSTIKRVATHQGGIVGSVGVGFVLFLSVTVDRVHRERAVHGGRHNLSILPTFQSRSWAHSSWRTKSRMFRFCLELTSSQ